MNHRLPRWLMLAVFSAVLLGPWNVWAAADAAGSSLSERLATSLSGYLQSNTLWLAFGVAWLGGFFTSLTPCVYPLIPITVRYFGAMNAVWNGWADADNPPARTCVSGELYRPDLLVELVVIACRS